MILEWYWNGPAPLESSWNGIPCTGMMVLKVLEWPEMEIRWSGSPGTGSTYILELSGTGMVLK